MARDCDVAVNEGNYHQYPPRSDRLAVAIMCGLSLVEVLAKIDGVLRIGDELDGKLETVGEHRIESARGRLRVYIHAIGQTSAVASERVWEQQ